MTPENLLIPRIKVMKDWPGRRDFEVGQVITLDKTFGDGSPMWEIEDCQGKRTYIMAFFKMFPAEFRLMEWWEERLPEEMSEYVKDVFRPGMKNDIFVYRIKKHFKRNMTSVDCGIKSDGKYWEDENGFSHLYIHYSPATESEYNTFIEFKK